MHLLKTFVAITFLVFTTTAEAASLQCRNLFVSNINAITTADVDQRIENLAISFLKISEMQPESKAQVIAHVNKELTSLMQVHENSIRLFKQKISELKDQAIESRQRKEKEDEAVRKHRAEVINTQAPINLARKAEFHEMRPGKFKMGEGFAKVNVEIKKPFAMMSTLMTQMMWARLQIAIGQADYQKINPSHFKTGDDSIFVTINGIEVQMKPNHPVEYVSSEDVMELLVGLNKLSSSKEKKDQDFLQHLIPGHKKGDVYDLPTEAQLEFVIRNRGRAKDLPLDSNYITNLDRRAWFVANSGGQTHEVATKQPLIVDGKEFFDLEGNVFEFCKDWYDEKFAGGVDPAGPEFGYKRVIRGGSFRVEAEHLKPRTRYQTWYLKSEWDVGFRLVRTAP